MRFLIAVILVFASGCSTLHNAPATSDMVVDKYPQIIAAENTAPPSVIFFIDRSETLTDLEREDFSSEPVTVITGGGESLSNVLVLAQRQVTPLLVAPGLEDLDVGMLSVKDMPLIKFLRYVRARYDIEYEYDRHTQVLTAKKNITRQVVLPPILDSQSGTIGTEDSVSVKAEPDHMRDIVLSTAERMGVDVTTMSETTGLLHLVGRPSAVNELCQIIETEATERLKFVTLHVMFLELGVNNAFEKDFDLEAIPNMEFLGSDIFGTFKFSVPPTLLPGADSSTLDAGSPLRDIIQGGDGENQIGSGIPVPTGRNSFGLVNNDKNKFASLITLLERWGQTEVVTAPAVMTANGVPVSFNITDEIGYWEPGEVDTTLGDAFGKSITEGKPEFIPDEVGLKLRIRPKVIRDSLTKEPLVELDIALENSEVYAFATTEWQRSEGLEPITLSKPLKSKKVLSSRAILRPDELLLLARLESKDNADARAGIPGVVGGENIVSKALTSEANKQDESQLFIVINAILPENLRRGAN